jgi:predicted flap endonuclease-1-like 5' DNA nuclease
VNGLTLLVLIALAIGIVVAYRAGLMRGTREGRSESATPWRPVATAPLPGAATVTAATSAPASAPTSLSVSAAADAAAAATAQASAPQAAAPVPAVAPAPVPNPLPVPDYSAEHARLIRSLEGETAVLRRALATTAGERDHLAQLAEERRGLWRDLAEARTDAARYRALVIDLENNALPPLLDGPNAPDDLKLIVGIGPVLERMLHQLGITTYRQIARWSERDIDEFDARLPEFPGRIRRDAWITQARALHHSKFGETLAPRDRG